MQGILVNQSRVTLERLQQLHQEQHPLEWAYGVITIPDRLWLLPKTLQSLANGGFPVPRLFIDGTSEVTAYREYGLPMTLHGGGQQLQIHGNWFLALHELFIREPLADRYALFQDDLVTCKNLRQYLEQTPYPDNGYCNLYTMSQDTAPIRANQDMAPYPGYIGWYPSNQFGRGAVALVFDRKACLALLKSAHMTERPLSSNGKRNVDGGIVTALSKAGIKEYVHNPSLVQHTGFDSTSYTPKLWAEQSAVSFRGETYDALSLANQNGSTQLSTSPVSNGSIKS
jgi:hypothetical protein